MVDLPDPVDPIIAIVWPFCTLKEILFLIDEVLDEDDSLNDLENISLSISERDYYMNTKK